MDEVNKAYQALNDLCLSIHQFQDEYGLRATFRSPIIDHHHPDDHSQRGIAGLSKFLGHAETERDYVNGLLQSPNPPNEFSTNAPHLLAVWSEFTRAKWPIVLISQLLDCGPQGQVKVDVVADGGNQWIKINTMKYSRLMAELREQDSYINSDYDSDSSHSNSGDSTGRTGGPPLTNSVIEQVQALLKAAKAYPRPTNLPPPTIRYVMNRLEEHPQQAYGDPRVEQTFRAIRQMGVELVLADTPAPTPARPFHPELRPTPKIMLDLSVIVALCCDTTHYPLPQHEDQIEARFRMRTASGDDLVEHSNTTKDLRDQLQWEVKHPLIEEIQQRLNGAGYRADEVEWFVTQEVKDRTPSILNIIGGPREKARANALYGTDADESFWLGSRYEGNEGILKDIVLKVIDEDRSVGSMKGNPGQLRQCMIDTCERMLVHTETHSGSAAPTPNSRPATPDPPVQPGRKVRKSRLPKRPGVVFPPNSRLPSPHTIRTMLAGLRNGMTVLTNNRGAVGKIVRELGIYDGFPSDLDNTPSDEHGKGEGEGGLVDALVWVVNPSSLAEWRRLEVEEANQALEETQDAAQAIG